MLITGRSDAPCWISVIDGEVKLHDAAQLWGQDTYQTQKIIQKILGEPKARIACIGAAGEHLV